MESMRFDESNIVIGKGQEDIYNPVYANIENKPDEGHQVLTICFKLTPEEIANINETGVIWYQQWKLPVMGMSPMIIKTEKPEIK